MTRSLTVRMVALSLLLSLLLTSSYVFFCFYGTQRTLLEQKNRDVQLLLNRTADYVNLYCQGLNANLLSLCGTLENQENDGEAIQSALRSFQLNNPSKVFSIACVTEDGETYCNRAAALEVFGNEYFQEFYRQAAGSNYRGLRWSEPYVSPLTLQRTVALYKPVRLSGREAVMIMEIDLGAMLSSILKATNDFSLTWAVVSHGGQLVATSDDYAMAPMKFGQISRAALENEIERLLLLPMDVRQCQIAGIDYIFFRQAAMYMDWTLIALSSRRTLSEAVKPLFMSTLWLGMLHLMLLAVIQAVLGQHYMRPLVRMAKKIQRSESPISLSFPELDERTDEVGALARSVENMIGRIRQLSGEREKMLIQRRLLEIKVLQDQIHPHFLGNTLACIQSLIQEGCQEKALSALRMLVRLLNYSIGRTECEATLEDELEYAEDYVHLRQIRGGNSFSYQTMVSPAHLQHPVPRLILQPIIENAITHGFAGLERPGGIWVTSYEQGGKLFLCVDDNGVGAPPETLAALNDGEAQPTRRAHGVGVTNVFKRLRLNDATENGSRILQNADGGVRVLLDLGVFRESGVKFSAEGLDKR